MPSAASSTPPEVWRIIFGFATRSETSFHVGYHPFEAIQELQETVGSHQRERIRLQTCTSLMLVSRGFRAVAAEFLFRDVRIHDAAGLESLMHGLARSAGDEGHHSLGSYVRRLELPARRFAAVVNIREPIGPFPVHPIPISTTAPQFADVLAYCPRVEIVVRPSLPLDSANIAFWASLVHAPILQPLKHLQRLEWHETELDTRFYGNNSSARLHDLVSQASNLRYLFLSSDMPNTLKDLHLPTTLRTLHLHRSQFHSIAPHRSTRRCYPVHVRQLVLHSTLPSSLLDFVEGAGSHLQVLELAFAPQMAFSSCQLQRILARTPVLEELVYHLAAPEITSLRNGVQAASVKRVRLKVNPDEWNPCKPVLKSQMEVLLGDSFPGLSEVVLHDPTGWFLKREVGREALRRLVYRGCAVVHEDGLPVAIPS
ncbi:hypothetical protein C8F01DRAFT_1164760 [Mycena amicta]|nr:hypothetical protein C8F01DRAFT_1164760 [Mycena amicta]